MQQSRIVVGVFDTGISNHRYATLFDYKTIDSLSYDVFSGLPGNLSDPNGHGSLIAQLLAAGINRSDFFPGVAPGVQIASLRIANDTGAARPSDVIGAMEWAMQKKAINVYVMPFGFHFRTNGHDPLCEMVNIAVANRISVVAAAGNGAFISAPGAARDAITVGNIQNDSLPNPSSAAGMSMHKPDLAAPGTNIYLFDSLEPSLKRRPYTGTSYAATIVAGAVAVLWAKFPTLTPLGIKDLLIQTCTPLGSGSWDSIVGNGMLNAMVAFDTLVNTPHWEVAFPHPMPGYQSDSPDIEFDTESGITAHVRDSILLTIYCNNSGASWVRVRLWGAPYGTSVENWLFLDTLISGLSPGLDTILLTYIPKISLPTVCFRTQIDCPFDSLPHTNFARKNRTGTFPTNQDTTHFSFDVVSNSCACVEMEITMPDLPDCWRIRLSDTVFTICPGDPPRSISGELWKDSLCCDSLRLRLATNGTQRSAGTHGCCLDSLSVRLFATPTSPSSPVCGCDPTNPIEVNFDSRSTNTLWVTSSAYALGCLPTQQVYSLCCDSTYSVFSIIGQAAVGPQPLQEIIISQHPAQPSGIVQITAVVTRGTQSVMLPPDTVTIAPPTFSIIDTLLVNALTAYPFPNDSPYCDYQWLVSNGVSSNSATFQHSFTSTGTFQLICIQNCDPCGTVSDTIDITISSLPVSTLLPSASPKFGIHPNPFSETLMLRCSGSLTHGVNAEIGDLCGNRIRTILIEANEWENGEVQMDTGNLASGLYFLNIMYDGESWVFKIVKL